MLLTVACACRVAVSFLLLLLWPFGPCALACALVLCPVLWCFGLCFGPLAFVSGVALAFAFSFPSYGHRWCDRCHDDPPSAPADARTPRERGASNNAVIASRPFGSDQARHLLLTSRCYRDPSPKGGVHCTTLVCVRLVPPWPILGSDCRLGIRGGGSERSRLPGELRLRPDF